AGPAYAPHHVGQVLAVFHLDAEQQRGGDHVAVDVADVLDVGFGIGNGGGHGGQHALFVDYLHAQLDLVVAADLMVPLDGDAALRRFAELGHVRALGAVHHDALARGQITDDGVARQRMAAIAEAEHAAFGAVDADLFRAAHVSGHLAAV